MAQSTLRWYSRSGILSIMNFDVFDSGLPPAIAAWRRAGEWRWRRPSKPARSRRAQPKRRPDSKSGNKRSKHDHSKPNSARSPRRATTAFRSSLESFADLDTPLSLYLKLANARYSYLLESVVGGERFGRYSFIGLPAQVRLRARGRRVEVVRRRRRARDVRRRSARVRRVVPRALPRRAAARAAALLRRARRHLRLRRRAPHRDASSRIRPSRRRRASPTFPTCCCCSPRSSRSSTT